MPDRAAQGGGKAYPLVPQNPGSLPYQVGVTFGNGAGGGADWFGPGQPMTPQAPPEVAGRAFDFPQGYNLINATRAYEPITYGTLRAFADGYDLLRLIIETRKDAMERLRWVIQLREGGRLSAQKRNKIKELTKFFLKPDGEHDWNTWLRMLLEDLFVIDAPSIYQRRKRNRSLYSLEVVDGATIRRVLDDWGRTPEGENETAYQQILKGMPAVNYRKSDLIFKPRNVRVHKVYGYSPVEQILMTVNIALRRQIWQLNFFTEGNMPESLIGVPEQWTPDQIKQFQTWFDNLLAGNTAERRKAKFVPSAVGKTFIPTQENELFGKAEEWLARVCCFAFSISPQPFLQMMNRSTADNASREAAATGLASIQNWVKSLVDSILADELDAADYEFVWRGDDELDPVKRQQITADDVKNGMLTVNEGRIANGREPYDDARFDEPMFQTSNGLAPLILTADAQGGTATATMKDANEQDGSEDVKAENQPTPGKDKSEETPMEKLQKLIEKGDVGELAEFLKTLEGANP